MSKNSKSHDVYDLVFNKYNEVAKEVGLPPVRARTPKRKRQISARLQEITLEELFEAIENLRDADFCQGANDRGWRADFDFCVQARSCIRLLEGVYGSNKRHTKTLYETLAENDREVLQ